MYVLQVPQQFLLDDYFIIRKYNELNHRGRAQININLDKNITQWLLFSFYIDHHILIDYVQAL